MHHQYEELLRIGSSYATQLTPGMEADFAVDTQDRIIALAGKNSGTQWQYAFLLATNTKSGRSGYAARTSGFYALTDVSEGL